MRDTSIHAHVHAPVHASGLCVAVGPCCSACTYTPDCPRASVCACMHAGAVATHLAEVLATAEQPPLQMRTQQPPDTLRSTFLEQQEAILPMDMEQPLGIWGVSPVRAARGYESAATRPFVLQGETKSHSHRSMRKGAMR